MKSVTLVGAPSYTSGSHMWKGTAPSLKATATTMNTRPMMTPSEDGALRRTAISPRSSVPVSP